MNTLVIGFTDGTEVGLKLNLDNVTKRDVMTSILKGESFKAESKDGTIERKVEDIVKLEII